MNPMSERGKRYGRSRLFAFILFSSSPHEARKGGIEDELSSSHVPLVQTSLVSMYSSIHDELSDIMSPQADL